MEYKLQKNSIGTMVTCLDTVVEQPVDIDFTLPDYCPDIEKIIRCKITPKIYNKNISGGQIQVDGTTVVTILYVDAEKNTLRACEQSVPFTANIQGKGLSENNVIEINTKGEYINCRALSPRRLAVHGAFSMYAKAECLEETTLYLADEDANVECNTKEIKVTALTSLCQNQFSVCDEISINNRPPVETILTSTVKANVMEYKVVSEKLILKGEISVNLMYLSNLEKGKVEKLDYVIPFSQVIDCENLSEDSLVCLNLFVMCYDLRLKSDMLSENPVISFDTKLCVTVKGYNEISASYITDAYSTQLSVDLEKSHQTIVTDANLLKDSFMEKEIITIGDSNISEILDISVEGCNATPLIDQQGITLNCKANISILALDEEKIPVYIERVIDFPKEIQCDYNFNNISDATLSIASLSYRIGEERNIELRCEMKYSLMISNQENLMVVSKIIGNEDSKIVRSPYALTLYYGEKGEKLWDIAKEYKTKLNLLHQENNLECDTLENAQMLLIPIV